MSQKLLKAERRAAPLRKAHMNVFSWVLELLLSVSTAGTLARHHIDL